jgi:selenocysteine lyase/cysteine desulfurase
MDRRAFVATGMGGVLGMSAWTGTAPGPPSGARQTARALFPRAEREVFLNGAGGTPLSTFAEAGITRYMDFIRLGPAEGRGAYRERVWTEVRVLFASLIGAKESEIGLVSCTKAGEQLVIDHLSALRAGGNIVTNDLHFSGSLHNLEGLRRSGMDVRVVRADPELGVSLERMADAIDDRTALVTVSLVSNVNGRIEPVAALAEVAHRHGALVFADIIQAAGAIPVDVRRLDVDVAACSAYKWLFGIHGAGFLFVREELQGTALPDHLFPGHVRRNYAPWIEGAAVEDVGDYTYEAPSSAVRYQPGHVSYVGYAAAYEGLRFLLDVGVQQIQAHSTALVARLLDQIDTEAWQVLTPEPERAPILSLRPPSMEGLVDRLVAAGVVVSTGGDMDRLMRISPAIYNDETDVDRLAEVLRSV